MLKALSVIYICWTPTDSLVLASEHPDWHLLKSEVIQSTLTGAKGEFIREEWDISGKHLVVAYGHPMVGNPENFCYILERSE